MPFSKESEVIFAAKEKAELADVERGTLSAGPGEVAGKTLATLISSGTELFYYSSAEKYPQKTGYTAVFEAAEIGADVKDVKPGDRILCLAPHQSRQRVPRADAVIVPEGLDPAVALFARIMAIPMTTLTTTTARPPEKVLVTGLGLVGNLAAQVFALCGYDVIACDPSGPRRALAEKAGIKNVFPEVPVSDPAVAGKVGLVLECSGHEQAALDGCSTVRAKGEVVLVGVPWKRLTDMHAHAFLSTVFHKYAVVRSGWEWELPRNPQAFQANSLYGNYAAAMKWLKEGKIKTDILFDGMPPDRCQEAYQSLLRKTTDKLTVVFDWR